MTYPLHWLQQTFRNKELTHELLDPEREKGNVSYHDYELAQSFFSSYQQYYPTLYSAASSAAAAIFIARKHPKWGIARRYGIPVTIGIPFFFAGAAHRAWTHVQFTSALENPAGFARALENVNTKMGGIQPLDVRLAVRREGRFGLFNPEDGSVAFSDRTQHTPARLPSQSAPTTSSDSGATVTDEVIPHRQLVIDAVDVQQSSSRRAIRKANMQAKQPSWDNLRQNLDQANYADAGKEDQQTEYNRPVADERAAEQAEFDALLEAERNLDKQPEGNVDVSTWSGRV